MLQLIFSYHNASSQPSSSKLEKYGMFHFLQITWSLMEGDQLGLSLNWGKISTVPVGINFVQ